MGFSLPGKTAYTISVPLVQLINFLYWPWSASDWLISTLWSLPPQKPLGSQASEFWYSMKDHKKNQDQPDGLFIRVRLMTRLRYWQEKMFYFRCMLCYFWLFSMERFLVFRSLPSSTPNAVTWSGYWLIYHFWSAFLNRDKNNGEGIHSGSKLDYDISSNFIFYQNT